MRVTKKRVIIFSLLMIMGVLSVVRIMYVNAEQQVRQTYTYKAGETFEYNGFQIRMEADIYSADDLKSMYQEIPEEVLAENEIMIRTEVKNISDEDLALLYNGAKAMIFPSSYEGFGLPLLESMACGTPVITCRNSSLDEIADNAAIYLEEPIETSLIDVMWKLEQNEIDNLEELVELGIKRASLFNWEKTARETVQVYSNLLNL